MVSGVCLALLSTSLFFFPASFNQIGSIGSASEIEEFADWRRIIPSTSNVYVANGQDSGAFAWFTLGRPRYLSVDQSAGVICSRTPALEVERRATFVLPLMDPDWKLLSLILERASANSKIRAAA